MLRTTLGKGELGGKLKGGNLRVLGAFLAEDVGEVVGLLEGKFVEAGEF